MSNSIVQITDATFQSEVLEADLPVLVDYWAEWCAPCKMIAPVLEALADEYAGQLKIGKLNIDDNPKTPASFNVRGIPTLMLFKAGDMVATRVGAASKSDLAAFVDSHL